MKNKKKKELRVNTAFMLEKSYVEKLDHFSEKIGISRSAMIRNCVISAITDLELLEKTGVLTVTSTGMNFLEILKSTAKKTITT